MDMSFMSVLGEYFPLILLILAIGSGLVVLMDQVFFKKAREEKILAETPDLNNSKIFSKKERLEKLKGPFLIDYCRSLFPVFLIVFVLRSFIGEFYQIPSASMIPNYLIGDYLYVNKFAYGFRFPIWGVKLIPVGTPKRGDVVIFSYPPDTRVDLIKRVVGLPGDHVSYINKLLSINGVPVPTSLIANQIMADDSETQAVQVYQENLSGDVHGIINMPWAPTHNFTNVIVPKGEYFVMGDNRDDSEDSRYWGFVQDKYLLGKPEMVIFSMGDQGVRWSRIGHLLN